MMIRRPEQEEEGVATGAERGGNGDLSKKRKGWQPEKEDEETAGRAILLAPSAVRGGAGERSSERRRGKSILIFYSEGEIRSNDCLSEQRRLSLINIYSIGYYYCK